MKIKTISRSLDDTLPQTHGAPPPKRRNLDPNLHPHARSREYTRAVTASKLDRMFAKPFLDSLEGHSDGVYCIARDTRRIGIVASGSANGEVIIWSLPSRTTTRRFPSAHSGFVNGICFAPTRGSSSIEATSSSGPSSFPSLSKKRLDDEGIEDDADVENMELEPQVDFGDAEDQALAGLQNNILSCGTDKTVKLWSGRPPADDSEAEVPLQTYLGKTAFNGIDHHRYEPSFATASDRVQVWDENRSEPLISLLFSGSSTSRHASKDNFSAEHVISTKFNQSETSVLASSGSDRSLCLYDMRSGSATSRMTMQMRGNEISFNPLQPPVLLVASEDQNLYTFDIRKLGNATQVFKGHVGAVMSCDWSPTGRSFVSGSYDRTVRIWDAKHGQSRDTYHTKRMQRIFSTVYSLDSRFILSGSDDGNIRLWKARASDNLGVMNAREKARMNYRDTLRDKWGSVGEVRKIERQRFLPSSIYNEQNLRRNMSEANRRKEENRAAHAPKNKKGQKPKAERQKAILKVDE